MNTELIQTRTDGNILHVVLNRAEKRNAMSAEMLCAVGDVIAGVDEFPEIRAVVLSGAGPIFSSGIDIVSLASARQAAQSQDPGRWLRRLAERMQHALHLIEATELPVIGALQGQVLGMGLELALACDLRVASDDCLLSIPESRMGLVADVGGTARLSRTVGPSRAKDLLMTSRSIDAAEALSWGLVNRVVPPGELMSATAQLADQIAANAPLAVGMAKLIVDQGDGLDKHTQMAIERWAQSQLISTDDVAEAAKAFMEKRPVKFTGR
jgi:enoyl-CoA hydratase/carnithine racemase